MKAVKELFEIPEEKTHLSQLTKRETRALIFQLLYTAESLDYHVSLESIIDNYKRGFNFEIPLDSEVIHIVQDIIAKRHELDTYYKPLLSNWRFERLGISTLLVLRYATWEFLYTDINPMIIINEAVELAKCFAEKDAYKFINGILDELLKSLPKKSPIHNPDT